MTPTTATVRRTAPTPTTAAPQSTTGPLHGQIVVDPENPGRMVYHDVYTPAGQLKPVFFAGPGDPENFFYSGRQDEIIRRLQALDARATYVVALLQDFGGGHPGHGAELEQTLAQWDRWITQMEEAGIITVFFFFDDNLAWPADWQHLVDRVVAKLKHHRLLIWAVAEEYREQATPQQVSEFAAYLKQVDDRQHVVAVHQNIGTRFDFRDDPHVDMFAMQANTLSPERLYRRVLDAWTNVEGRKIINMSELAEHGLQDDATIRRLNWASAMAGASAVQVLKMGLFHSDRAGHNTSTSYRDAAILSDFMEQTDFHRMRPHTELAAGGTKWLLAQPGRSYLAYTDDLQGNIGIQAMVAGTYRLRWLDIPSGKQVLTTAQVQAGTHEFAPPGEIGQEVAVFIQIDSQN